MSDKPAGMPYAPTPTCSADISYTWDELDILHHFDAVCELLRKVETERDRLAERLRSLDGDDLSPVVAQSYSDFVSEIREKKRKEPS